MWRICHRDPAVATRARRPWAASTRVSRRGQALRPIPPDRRRRRVCGAARGWPPRRPRRGDCRERSPRCTRTEGFPFNLGLVAVDQVSPAGDARERASPSDDLAESRQVRSHSVIALGALVGQPEAGHHLVEDQQQPVPVAEAPETFEESGSGSDDPFHRLGDDPRYPVHHRGHQPIESIEVVVGDHQHGVPHRRGRPGGEGTAGRIVGLWVGAAPAIPA